jgi:hypothetical protein
MAASLPPFDSMMDAIEWEQLQWSEQIDRWNEWARDLRCEYQMRANKKASVCNTRSFLHSTNVVSEKRPAEWLFI